MGWFKILRNLGKPEGRREAMRMSYQKHVGLAKSGRMPTVADDPPEHIGLFGALKSFYLTHGVERTDIDIWPELVPFLLMDSSVAPEALAEYAVFQENPSEAKISWLRHLINESLRRPVQNEEYRGMAGMAALNYVKWCDLLDADVAAHLDELTEETEDAIDGMANTEAKPAVWSQEDRIREYQDLLAVGLNQDALRAGCSSLACKVNAVAGGYHALGLSEDEAEADFLNRYVPNPEVRATIKGAIMELKETGVWPWTAPSPEGETGWRCPGCKAINARELQRCVFCGTNKKA